MTLEDVLVLRLHSIDLGIAAEREFWLGFAHARPLLVFVSSPISHIFGWDTDSLTIRFHELAPDVDHNHNLCLGAALDICLVRFTISSGMDASVVFDSWSMFINTTQFPVLHLS